MWLTKNDDVFSRAMPNSYLQVIFRGTFWARHWSLLSNEEAKELLKRNCQLLEGVMLDFSAKGGWNFSGKLQG